MRQYFFHGLIPKILCVLSGGAIVLQIILPLLFFHPLKSRDTNRQTSNALSHSLHHSFISQNLFRPVFGQFVPDTINDNAIKQSLLNFKIVGIVLSNTARESRAVIREQGGDEKIYRQGDILCNGVKIQRITTDEVLIEHEGELERLIMRKSQLSFFKLQAQSL